MKFKKGDLVIMHPRWEDQYVLQVRYSSHFIGKVEVTRGNAVKGKIIASDLTHYIGDSFGIEESDLLTINEAIKLGLMYSEFSSERETVHLEFRPFSIDFQELTETIPVNLNLSRFVERRNEYIEGLRNFIEGDIYGRRRNQR